MKSCRSRRHVGEKARKADGAASAPTGFDLHRLCAGVDSQQEQLAHDLIETVDELLRLGEAQKRAGEALLIVANELMLRVVDLETRRHRRRYDA